MPELPEVETIRRGLATRLPGLRIVAASRSEARLRRDAFALDGLVGRTFLTAQRHGKFLLLGFDDGSVLTVHLGMSGKLLFAEEKETLRPHTHLRLGLSDGSELRYVDPRRFGMLAHHPASPVPELAHYGPDALDALPGPSDWAETLARSSQPAKSFLLDQRHIAGLGNIYACEALWRAGVSPRRRACNIPRAKVALLHDAVAAVLEDALAAGGTSFNDYVDAIGQAGTFLMDVAVFRREGQPCPRCGRAVARITQSGRSTFYCPGCQK